MCVCVHVCVCLFVCVCVCVCMLQQMREVGDCKLIGQMTSPNPHRQLTLSARLLLRTSLSMADSKAQFVLQQPSPAH